MRAFNLGASISVKHDFQRSTGLTSQPQQAHELRFVDLDHHALNRDPLVPELVGNQRDVLYSLLGDAVPFQRAASERVSLASAGLAK